MNVLLDCGIADECENKDLHDIANVHMAPMQSFGTCVLFIVETRHWTCENLVTKCRSAVSGKVSSSQGPRTLLRPQALATQVWKLHYSQPRQWIFISCFEPFHLQCLVSVNVSSLRDSRPNSGSVARTPSNEFVCIKVAWLERWNKPIVHSTTYKFGMDYLTALNAVTSIYYALRKPPERVGCMRSQVSPLLYCPPPPQHTNTCIYCVYVCVCVCGGGT